MFPLCFVLVLWGLQRDLLESEMQNDTANDGNFCSFHVGSGYGWMPETLPFKCAVFFKFSMGFVSVFDNNLSV